MFELPVVSHIITIKLAKRGVLVDWSHTAHYAQLCGLKHNMLLCSVIGKPPFISLAWRN